VEKKTIHLYLISILVLTGNIVLSQNINFKRYGIEQGLIHPTIYTLNQDKTGFVWIGTGAGVCRFDGVKFQKPYSTDSISEAYANASYRSKDGNMWFGYDDGSICTYNNRKLRKVYRNEISPSIITAISENDENQIIALSQNSGIYVISKTGTKNITTGVEGKLLYCLSPINNKNFLIGTGNGLWLVHFNLEKVEIVFDSKIEGIPDTKIQCIVPSVHENKFWIGTEDEGAFELKVSSTKNFDAVKVSTNEKLASSNVQWILEDKQENLWVCTFGNGVFKLLFDNKTNKYPNYLVYNQDNGIGDNYIKKAFQDQEGNIWFGTYSNGLSGIVDEAFVFYNFKTESLNNDIMSVASSNEGTWLGSRKSLYFISNNSQNDKKIITEKNGLPNDNIISLKIVDNKTLYIGTEKNGLYSLTIGSERISKFLTFNNSLESSINAIEYSNGTLWLGTNGGVISYNIITGKKEKFSTDTDLPHNKINELFVDSKGIVWIATKSTGLVSVNSKLHYKMDGIGEIEFTGISEDKNGNLWATTYGDGLFCFRKDSIIHLSESNGLKSNYGYSISTDEEGNIWVGHRLSLSKVNPESLNIITYGQEIGITGDCNRNAVSKDISGTLRFGTTDGLIQYNYNKFRQKMAPPSLNLLSVKISDKEYDFEDEIDLPYGTYRIRFDFVGLNFAAPSAVKYQYKLDGWESEWSEITNNTFAYYPRVDDGNFKFIVRAYNAEGITAQEPFSIVIKIKAPLWKRWWFILLSIAMIVALLYLYIKYRERKQIQFQLYLQKMLDERTREVVEQKEEIENKNRDITDSITYAQRIQTSILPSVKKLQDSFSGCFIFYQPRDIVSGDFYWYDKVTETKFSIVCGDSTGHGVPGALMSMIGTTLIKDICNRPDVVSPSNILEKLDEEMMNTLNQNIEAEKSSDGMDLIACEIDTETHIVKIASAMRPVILYQNGEQIYVQGSKSSIGGNEFANECKDFEDQVFQLSKGDLIYMFSDGYPDQFGGPMGKKFKMVRLRNLLRDVHELPMEEQYHHIKNTFNLWRDQHDQVDDVLFMGIRL
jgi:ligand-binding sensor domain-containing protein/serine phosphatase RsbU (regulator of sigma subunit)